LLERQAVRAILLSPEEEVLLMRIRNPGNGRVFWICPGGGLEAGEDPQEGLRRELREEVGLSLFPPGHLVHRRHHVFDWKDKRISQREAFFLVHVERFTPRMIDAVELENLLEFRWWPVAKLVEAEHPVTPRTLEAIVSSYLRLGPPVGELVVESQTD